MNHRLEQDVAMRMQNKLLNKGIKVHFNSIYLWALFLCPPTNKNLILLF